MYKVEECALGEVECKVEDKGFVMRLLVGPVDVNSCTLGNALGNALDNVEGCELGE